MLNMNTATYYRLLNCGLRLAAGAGSATGVKAAPVGYNRAYVRVAEDASIEEFYRAWKRGSNFVTNGPILQLSTASNRRPGDTIKLSPSGGTIDVLLEVVSDQPLQTVQVERFDHNKHAVFACQHSQLGSLAIINCYLLSVTD